MNDKKSIEMFVYTLTSLLRRLGYKQEDSEPRNAILSQLKAMVVDVEPKLSNPYAYLKPLMTDRLLVDQSKVVEFLLVSACTTRRIISKGQHSDSERSEMRTYIMSNIDSAQCSDIADCWRFVWDMTKEFL